MQYDVCVLCSLSHAPGGIVCLGWHPRHQLAGQCCRVLLARGAHTPTIWHGAALRVGACAHTVLDANSSSHCAATNTHLHTWTRHRPYGLQRQIWPECMLAESAQHSKPHGGSHAKHTPTCCVDACHTVNGCCASRARAL